jgi:hypothetical protein
MKTTLRKIRKFTHSDFDGKKLLTFLQKTEADDEELSLLTILESNGLNDALWALRFVEGFDKEIRLMACDFAESVVHLANDERSVNAIKVSRDYANGVATKEELNAAAAASHAASHDASHDVYGDYNAVRYAFAACAAAWAADIDAAKAACTAASDAINAFDAASVSAVCNTFLRDYERKKQIEIFKKYVKQINK